LLSGEWGVGGVALLPMLLADKKKNDENRLLADKKKNDEKTCG
jgi:hypothetical protein